MTKTAIISRSILLILVLVFVSSIFVFPVSAKWLNVTKTESGELYKDGVTGWANLHDATLGTKAAGNMQASLQASSYQWVKMGRGYATFDTTSLNSTDTINHVYFTFSSSNGDFMEDYWDLYNFTPGNDGISGEDYDQFETTEYIAGSQSTIEKNTELPTYFINKSGWTYLGFRWNKDALNTAPSQWAGRYMYYYFGTPEIDIDYEPALPYDTDLSASGIFCSYNTINFTLEEASGEPGYFEIYLYKDSYPDGDVYGDQEATSDIMSYSRALSPGNYYTQGFYTPDAMPENTYGEWLNFTIYNNCTVAPMGTISSENITHGVMDYFWYTWVAGEYNTSTQSYDYNLSTGSQLAKLYQAGLINETQYNAAMEYYINISESEEMVQKNSLIVDNFAIKQHSVDELSEAGSAIHSNFNVSFSILSNYTEPLTYMGAYAVQFFPAPVVDLITAYLIIQAGFLLLFHRKD